jgi:hypothetical protein
VLETTVISSGITSPKGTLENFPPTRKYKTPTIKNINATNGKIGGFFLVTALSFGTYLLITHFRDVINPTVVTEIDDQ